MFNIIELIKLFIISLVQGITEWLPVSSTGHMILVNDLIQLNVSTEFWNLFEVLVQLGSIFAVVILYFHKLNPFSPKKTKEEKSDTWVLWFKVVVATLPAMVIGLLLDDWISEHMKSPFIVALMLIIYGVAFIWIESNNESSYGRQITSLKQLTYQTAFYIGLFQTLSLIPGTSRSGATILGALIVGASRPVAAEFSFFMGIPVMFGASFLRLLKFGLDFTGLEFFYLSFGMIVAFVVSILCIHFLMSYIRKHDFKAFGYYRIILGLIVITYTFLFK